MDGGKTSFSFEVCETMAEGKNNERNSCERRAVGVSGVEVIAVGVRNCCWFRNALVDESVTNGERSIGVVTEWGIVVDVGVPISVLPVPLLPKNRAIYKSEL